MKKKHHIIGGGTFAPVRGHMALASMAFGTTAKTLHGLMTERGENAELHLTKMADSASNLVTNDDVARLVDKLVLEEGTGIVFFNPALVDFNGQIGGEPASAHAPRLDSRRDMPTIVLTAAEKIIGRLRRARKDIFVVGFKATTGDTPDLQYVKGLRLLKESSCNLVLANDTVTRMNMIIAPEETRYHQTTDRDEVLAALADMALARFGLTYTRSTVLDGPRVDWNGPDVPETLRKVVDHCIARGAYKPFRGKTAGHFAARGKVPGEFLTSARGSNFNQLAQNGLVRVVANGDDEVIAYGAKPSVGGQSQRIVFEMHPELNCIVHFHCPTREGSAVKLREQRPYECGSHECGRNTAEGLMEYGDGIHAVMLDNHGPNIVFSDRMPAEKVIAFIEANFDLDAKTGGRVDLLDAAPLDESRVA